MINGRNRKLLHQHFMVGWNLYGLRQLSIELTKVIKQNIALNLMNEHCSYL